MYTINYTYFNLNTNKCDPIITFQKSSDINSSCNNASQRLPFLQVTFDLKNSIINQLNQLQ